MWEEAVIADFKHCSDLCLKAEDSHQISQLHPFEEVSYWTWIRSYRCASLLYCYANFWYGRNINIVIQYSALNKVLLVHTHFLIFIFVRKQHDDITTGLAKITSKYLWLDMWTIMWWKPGVKSCIAKWLRLTQTPNFKCFLCEVAYPIDLRDDGLVWQQLY
jgi:hypothetical protein